LFGSRTCDFTVRACEPGPECVITPTTRLLVPQRTTTKANTNAPATTGALPTYEDIGGLGQQLTRIREMIELPLRFPEVFERLGIDPPKGVLLHGPPGTGKTLIARTIAHESDANFFVISGPEIVHKNYGESEKHLRQVWEQASKKSPAIIFIDEIDSIAPKRSSVEGEVEKRIVAQLLALMDGLNKRANIVVIAATNLPNNIDPALRRPGRFDREIEIPIPDARGRRQILDVHTRGMPLEDDVDLDRLASITHGCVGADLEALCREAAMACLRSVMGDIDFNAGSPPYDLIASLRIAMDHFREAMTEVEPSAVREVFVEVPNIGWDDIGGLGDVKRRLIEAVEWPLAHAELFRETGVRPPKGILLAGPPGIGKTLAAKAVASQTEANFISVKGPELMSKFVGTSEERLREIFRKARQASPCIVFFDEIDAMLPKRGLHQGDAVGDRVLAQFLAEMDGVEELNGVLVLGATNRLDMLDPAMLRPGRFDEVVELETPNEEARKEIFEVHLKD
ncbi:MAG: AAA family ATPase, partial [Planctomycetota bacterium]